MGAEYESLLFYTEIRWLSRGKVLTRLFELRHEVREFLLTQNMLEICQHLDDDYWIAKLAYMADIFQHLNELNKKMKGRNENILTCSDKLQGVPRNSRKNFGASATAFPSPSGSPNSALQYLKGIIVAAKGTTATPYPTETNQSCPRDTSQLERLNTLGTSAQIMETDETPVSPNDAQQRCTRIYDIENQIYEESCKLTFYDQLIKGELERFQGPSDQLPRYIKEREELQAFLSNIKVALLFPCPFPTCHQNTAPKHLELTSTPSANSSLADKLAETHIREEPINNEKAKKNLLDGFTSPSKTAKRARIL
ncbi:zinc finger BED domain-containing protein 5 [Trichonephila clavata]|uniref:Zinc finger BED domain-containing protein 5 n=1 Tax=Trichonephila clavata TaxID=2740835 RepID=A0A8X6J0D6_TRICU|nr:zinc finger BED domain-containing protein 5 [Trichonephila clavata]